MIIKSFNKQVFINKCFQGCLVKRGNKQRALNIFDNVLFFLRNNTTEHPLLIIEDIVENLKPSMSLWAKKVGGTSYKLPYLISEKKGLSIAIHWVIKEATGRSERTVAERVGNVLLECYLKRNTTLQKKKDEIHKIALHNRAFLRFK